VFLPEVQSIADSLTPLMADVDIVKLLAASKGIVLGVVILLLTMVVVCFFVIAYKLVHISQAESQSIKFLDRFWESKRLDDIYRIAEGMKYSPLAKMFSAGYVELSKLKKGKGGDSIYDKMEGTENIERALARAQVSELTKLENLLPFLATTGSAAPFVGLFGTVWGIMDAFLSIAEQGTAELAEVSQPIAEALVTTALALASAVPAVVAYNYFNRRLKVLSAEMQTFGNDYLNIVRRHFF
jgi:biopolymer transport protein TolQ